MALNTSMTFLMHRTTKSGVTPATYAKLVDITEYPDIGGAPEMLETTTLSNKMKTYISGIQSNEGLQFGANYTREDYAALKELEDSVEGYAVWFGGTENPDGTVTPTGSDGKWAFDGQLAVHPTGSGTNQVRGMSINIAPNTDIVPIID